MSVSSCVVVPRSVIFAFWGSEERGKVGILKGGRRRPGLGAMSNF